MVCHSLGGILCRNYLLHVKLRWGHQFLSLMRATITLGTPLSGSELANFLVLSSNEQSRVLRPQDVNDFLQLLNESTAEFELKRNYLSCPPIVLYAGYAKHDTPLVEGVPVPFYRVVPQDSATLDVDARYTKGFEMDHRQLAKPETAYWKGGQATRIWVYSRRQPSFITWKFDIEWQPHLRDGRG